MEVLPEPLEPHGAEKYANWSSRFADHLMWFLSRGLLILFIVLVAYFSRVPFQRLIARDVVLEMEEMEKQKALEEYKTVRDLDLSANKFEPLFVDSVRAVCEYERTPANSLREIAQSKLHGATLALDQLRERFGNRQVALNRDLESDVEHLIEDGDYGLKIQINLMNEGRGRDARKSALTFGACKELIDQDVSNIDRYERAYVDSRRRTP